MKKRIFIMICIFIVVLIASLCILNSTLSKEFLKWGPVISSSIDESERRCVFIKEYISPSNPCKINDTLEIMVKEAWIEYQWYYGDNVNETWVPQNSRYQLRINSIKQDVGKYTGIDWSIGISGDKYLRSCGSTSLRGDFRNMPGDTIEYIVVKGGLQNNMDTTGKVLGKFVLLEKK